MAVSTDFTITPLAYLDFFSTSWGVFSLEHGVNNLYFHQMFYHKQNIHKAYLHYIHSCVFKTNKANCFKRLLKFSGRFCISFLNRKSIFLINCCFVACILSLSEKKCFFVGMLTKNFPDENTSTLQPRNWLSGELIWIKLTWLNGYEKKTTAEQMLEEIRLDGQMKSWF